MAIEEISAGLRRKTGLKQYVEYWMTIFSMHSWSYIKVPLLASIPIGFLVGVIYFSLLDTLPIPLFSTLGDILIITVELLYLGGGIIYTKSLLDQKLKGWRYAVVFIFTNVLLSLAPLIVLAIAKSLLSIDPTAKILTDGILNILFFPFFVLYSILFHKICIWYYNVNSIPLVTEESIEASIEAYERGEYKTFSSVDEIMEDLGEFLD